MKRRTFLASAAAASLAACSNTSSQSSSRADASPVVLVHGATLGGWLWFRTVPLIARAGHPVYAPSLTGLGDRDHLLERSIDMSTHARDIANTIEANELTNVTLVAHSYAGIPATVVADRLGPRVISKLVYVDALVPTDGMAWRDFHTAQQQANLMKVVQERGDGWKILAPPPAAVGVTVPADVEWMNRRLRPQPFGTYDEKARLPNGGYERFTNRVYIDCTTPPLPTINSTKARLRAETGWRHAAVDGGHCAMVTHAARITEIILNG
jgi:pimeloyl-ACP methyl ester carboxylesterase